jgi:branched-subunit amino acid aminotransferase/4-amino-4-deoxychorismate lyase
MTSVMLNGEVLPLGEAALPVTDRALTHGLGLYETLKLVGGVPVFFEEHIARLDLGLETLGLERPASRAEMAAQITAISKATGVADGACRVLVTAGAPGGIPNLLIQTDQRLFPARPLRVITYHGVRIRAELKAMTVMQSYLAQRAATAAGVDDAILVDDEGRMFEGATSNLFLVRGGGLVTPPAEGAILPGVLRAKVEELGSAAGLTIVEAYARVADLRAEDGMLLTSSVRGIVAVANVDGRDLRVNDDMLARLQGLVTEAETASAASFRTSYA